VIPLYGFVQGDTMGVVVLAEEEETIASLAHKLQTSVAVRIRPRPNVRVMHRGRALDPAATVRKTRLARLDRIDVEEA
jgi:hypothetical protein